MRLTNVAIYSAYIRLCALNVRYAGYHGDDDTANVWLNRFIKACHFMSNLGYRIVGDDVFTLHFEEIL